MEKILTLSALGQLPWAGEFSVCTDNRPFADNSSGQGQGNARYSSFVARTQVDEATIASVDLTIDPVIKTGNAPFLLCLSRGLPIPLVCPHCGGYLSGLPNEIAELYQVPAHELGMSCRSCGLEKGVYVEKVQFDKGTPIVALSALFKAWNTWIVSPEKSPPAWVCANCNDKALCYDAIAPLAPERIVLFRIKASNFQELSHVRFTLQELSELIAGRPSGALGIDNLNGGYALWKSDRFTIQDIFTLKLKLFDSIVAGIQDHLELQQRFPALGLDTISVQVLGSPRAPHFLPIFTTQEMPDDKPIAHNNHNLRQIRAKFQVVSVGTAEDPHVDAVIHLLSSEEVLETGATVGIVIRKDDGLPVDCSLKFQCMGGTASDGWRLKSAEPIATPLLQYFRILRVVPAFDVNAEVPGYDNNDTEYALWAEHLGKLLVGVLFANGRLDRSHIESEIGKLSREIASVPEATNAYTIIATNEIFQPNNLHFDTSKHDLLESTILGQPIFAAVCWLNGRVSHDNPIEALESIRKEIYAWMSMRPLVEPSSDMWGDASDDELISILKELAVDLGLSTTEQTGAKAAKELKNTKSPVHNRPGNTSKSVQKTNVLDSDFDSTMVISREEISRINASRNKSTTSVKDEQDLESTMVISPSSFPSAPARNGGRLASEPDTQVTLDETVVISRGPKPR